MRRIQKSAIQAKASPIPGKPTSMSDNFGFRLIFSLTVLWLTTGIGICLYRRSSAAVRHRIWGLSMVAALVLPLVLFVLPTVRLGWFEAPPNIMAFESPIPVLGNQSSRFERSDITNTPPPSPTKVSVAVETPDGVAVVRKAPAAVYRLWLLWIIAAPCLWGLSTLTRSLLASQRILAESAVVNDTSCCQMSAALARAIHLRAIVQLRQSSRIHVPVCTGWWTPQIVLPSWWRTWSQETLRAVIAHELSHAVRCDVSWQLIARLACSRMWFHPLAWLVAWRMRVEREFACDDSVLQLGESPTVGCGSWHRIGDAARPY